MPWIFIKVSDYRINVYKISISENTAQNVHFKNVSFSIKFFENYWPSPGSFLTFTIYFSIWKIILYQEHNSQHLKFWLNSLYYEWIWKYKKNYKENLVRLNQ